jgi:hypothetical protein
LPLSSVPLLVAAKTPFATDPRNQRLLPRLGDEKISACRESPGKETRFTHSARPSASGDWKNGVAAACQCRKSLLVYLFFYLLKKIKIERGAGRAEK